MKLGRENILTRHRTGERRAVHRFANRQIRIKRIDVVAVHEIVVCIIGDIRPERMWTRLLDRIPAHMRHFERRTVFIARILHTKPHHLTGEPAQAVRIAFLRMTEQHLLTHADAEQRFVFRTFGQGFE